MTPKFNVHRFLTNDISAHCKKIRHKFSPLDMAVIVRHSQRPLAEKLSAWQAIINSFPDMPIRANANFTTKKSLHKHLKKCIVWEERKIASFYVAKDHVFRSFVCYVDNEENRDEGIGSYSSVEKAVVAAKEYAKRFDLKVSRISIHKEKVNSRTWVYDSAVFNPNGDLLEVYGHGMPHGNDLEYVLIDLPVPFENGDIIMDGDSGPFVVTCLPHTYKDYAELVSGKSSNADGGDLCGLAYRFEKCSDGVVRLSHSHPMLYHMQFYKKELHGRDRFLKDLGQHIKEADSRDVIWLIDSYNKYKAEAEASSFCNSC